ncbi:OST-HTH/LOTUS domain-containing protein [Cyclonatronum proteinivorum]|uniref:OST-HTH/LOTUS domain-containing protein n=1 Tax=Cyclonatronum proteinivorum TaxID=1457365 RepID=A0A345UGT2_9BACT|nr:NYN domain-containing protein [Cyclonatronum proteinivorum]AXI99683.1 OST-HTH/LOTUS domain-containing protein [Cyclonatronum proteinivorum]
MNPHSSEPSMQALRNLSDLRLAVLIDADNISYNHINNMMVEITRYGTPTFKRIYGDWTQPNLAGWKNVLLDYAITPIQQYSYTKGKNATDSALIIDAMDILYSGKVDGFCIVSSDSDFTRLATRLREAGMRVIGMGEKKTPKPFITACDRFLFIEVLADSSDQDDDDDSGSSDSSAAQKSGSSSTENDTSQKSKSSRSTAKKKRKTPVERHIKKMLRLSVSDVADEDGWAFLGEVGNMILKKEPSFDPRNYGFTKLTPLLKDLKLFEFDERQPKGSNVRHIYIRDKRGQH